MSVGSNLQKSVEKIINKFGTTVILQNLTETVNGYGAITGYTIVGTGTVKAVPSNFFKNKLGRQPFGQLNEGEVRMLFPGGTSYTSLKGTANQWRALFEMDNYLGTYIIKEEKPIPLTGVNVAIPVVFTLEEEDGY